MAKNNRVVNGTPNKPLKNNNKMGNKPKQPKTSRPRVAPQGLKKPYKKSPGY